MQYEEHHNSKYINKAEVRIMAMKVVIMAGGKGTRITSVASDIPKPMIKIEGIPVLEREIECLRNQGFDDIIIPLWILH